MRMDEQSGPGVLGRIAARTEHDGRWRRALRCAICAAFAFSLSLVRTPGDSSPFGVAFVAAAGTGWGGAAALLGAAGGYLLGGIGWGVRYLAASTLCFAVAYIFREFPFGRAPLFMPFAAAAVTAPTAFLGSFSFSGTSSPELSALVLETAGGVVRVPLRQIRYADVQGNYVTVHAREDYVVRRTMAELAASLDERFHRLGRSVIVNLTCVRRVSRREVILEDGTAIPLPRGAYEAVNRAIINMK